MVKPLSLRVWSFYKFLRKCFSKQSKLSKKVLSIVFIKAIGCNDSFFNHLKTDTKIMITDFIVPLISLIALEVILGIDNIIFISILVDKLPDSQRNKLRYWGIGLAMLIRLGLLAVISVILKLDKSLIVILENDLSGKDLILIAGGLFLIYKSTKEIFEKTENDVDEVQTQKKKGSFKTLLLEIIVLDLVFSIDSIITAVGMVQELWIMYTAVIVAVFVMLIASGPISNFIRKHPSFKILALCFLLIIGISLIG